MAVVQPPGVHGAIEQGIRKTYDWYTANHRPAFLTGRFTEKVDLA